MRNQSLMKNALPLLTLSILLIFAACSKKTTPEKTSTPAAGPVFKAPVKTATPQSIVVNEAAAKKDVNGRYYYDLEGKRYWRNNKDGRYYLYYKGMFNDKNFQ